MIAVSLSFPYEDTMVSRRGNGRFSTRKLSFLYLKRKSPLPVPVILYYITVEILTLNDSQFFGGIYNPLLLGGSERQFATAFQVVVFTSQISDHPIAERVCHAHCECIYCAHESFGVTHLFVRTEIVTFFFYALYMVWIHNWQKNFVCRGVF